MFEKPANSASMVSSTTRLAPDRVDGVAQADEQPFEVVLAGLLDLAALDVDVVDGELLLRAPAASRSKPSERDVAGRAPRSVSSKAMNTPGSPNSVAPRTRNSMASSVLPQPAPPQTSVGRPAGRPPRDLVEARNAREGLPQLLRHARRRQGGRSRHAGYPIGRGKILASLSGALQIHAGRECRAAIPFIGGAGSRMQSAASLRTSNAAWMHDVEPCNEPRWIRPRPAHTPPARHSSFRCLFRRPPPGRPKAAA